jgi:hypothetical protein
MARCWYCGYEPVSVDADVCPRCRQPEPGYSSISRPLSSRKREPWSPEIFGFSIGHFIALGIIFCEGPFIASFFYPSSEVVKVILIIPVVNWIVLLNYSFFVDGKPFGMTVVVSLAIWAVLSVIGFVLGTVSSKKWMSN